MRLLQLTLIGLLVMLPTGLEKTRPLSNLTWPPNDWVPGGLSGLLVSPSGERMLAVSDRGFLISAGLMRDGQGRITGLSGVERFELAQPPRANWRGPPELYTDAEGLAQLPDGRIAVSWEGLHRVTLHHPDGRFSQWIDVPEAFANLLLNQSLEGVALSPEGEILAMAEGWPPSGDARVPLFAHDGETWRIRAWLTRTERFRPVGLDTDQAGRLYVLERRLSLRGGFQTRIRRFALGADSLSEEVELLRVSGYGNLEGLSLRSSAEGGLIASMVADNNLLPLLPRGIVEFYLPAR